MERHPCRWWLLPGNDDFARNGGLWDRVRRRGAANVTVLAQAEAHALADDAWLLPAPLLHRHTLDDRTEPFDRMETSPGALRIGLAHGSIRGSGSQNGLLLSPHRDAAFEAGLVSFADDGAVLVSDRREPTAIVASGWRVDRRAWRLRARIGRSSPGIGTSSVSFEGVLA